MLPDGPLASLLRRLEDWEGEVRILEGGRKHRLLIRQGRPVAAHIIGHFDPLLTRLRRQGALDQHAWERALGELARSERRCGEIAKSQGVQTETITRALHTQLRDALAHLSRCMGTRFEVELAEREVAAREVVAWLPRAPKVARRPGRHTLRNLARTLHPDRLGHLSAGERRRCEARLARLNALAQGL